MSKSIPMEAKKNNGDKCNITLKNVPCDLKVFFNQQAIENERSLSGEIINILKQVKSSPNIYRILFNEMLSKITPKESEELSKWRERQNKMNITSQP